MKKIILLMSGCLIAFGSLQAEQGTSFEECCEITPVLPPPTNCSDAETQKIGFSMMGFGLALIAAIAIVAGTVDQSLSDGS